MRKINILIILAVGLWAFVSCGKGDDPSPDFPDGGKNDAFPIQFYSRLSNSPLFNTDDFAAVTGRIRASQTYITILHRVDAVYSLTETQNPMVTVAAETGKIPIFIRNRYSGARVEGSGVLVGQTIAEMSNTPVSDACSYFSVPLTANGNISINFATITFENENQLTAGVSTIKEKLDDKTILAGAAAKTLQTKLKSAFSEENYRLEIIESKDGNTNQIIFVLSSRKWAVLEYNETAVGTDRISCFNLKIEKL